MKPLTWSMGRTAVREHCIGQILSIPGGTKAPHRPFGHAPPLSAGSRYLWLCHAAARSRRGRCASAFHPTCDEDTTRLTRQRAGLAFARRPEMNSISALPHPTLPGRHPLSPSPTTHAAIRFGESITACVRASRSSGRVPLNSGPLHCHARHTPPPTSIPARCASARPDQPLSPLLFAPPPPTRPRECSPASRHSHGSATPRGTRMRAQTFRRRRATSGTRGRSA